MNLKKYIAYRRAELKHQADSLGAPNSIGTAYHVEVRQRIQQQYLILQELERFTDWTEQGEPDFIPPLSGEEKVFWAKARARGVEIPADVEAQL